MLLANSPERSATPAPSITTNTYPSGWKWVKVFGMSVHTLWMFSAEEQADCCQHQRPGSILCQFRRMFGGNTFHAQTTEIPTKIPINQTKMKTGSGSRFPVRLTNPKNPF